MVLYYRCKVLDEEVEMPIRKVDSNTYIASNHEILEDVKFIKECALVLGDKIKKYNPEAILIPEAKALGLVYFLSDSMNVPFAIAKKGIKAYMEDPVSSKTNSITTKNRQILSLDKSGVEKIKYRNVALVDDVISTGGTMRTLINICDQVYADPVCIGVIWTEGKKWKIFNKIPVESLSHLPVWDEASLKSSKRIINK